jgi:hypothetical protein
VYVASLPAVVRAVVGLVRGAFNASGVATDGDIPTNATSAADVAHEPRDETKERDVAAFERAKLVPFVLYVPLAAIAFGISNLKLRMFTGSMEVGGYRYLLPTLLFAVVLGSVWCARWWNQRGVARVGAALLGVALFAPAATTLAIPDWTFREVGNGFCYEGYNYAQLSRGLLSARNAVPQDEIIARVSQWPTDVRERVVRGLGFNLCLLEIERAKSARRDAWVIEIERVIDGYPAEWHLLMANGAGAALHFQRPVADVPSMLQRVRPVNGPLFEEVVAGSATKNVSLFVGEDSVATFHEDVQLLALDLPGKSAFERGCGHYFGRLLRRGIPHEVELVKSFSATHSTPAFEEGLQRGRDGLER